MSTAASVLNRVRYLINDESASAVSGLRWSDTELLGWLFDAQCDIVKQVPEANPVTATHTVTAVARQRLDPTTYYKLLSIEGHASPSGLRGNIVKVDKDFLNVYVTTWQAQVVSTYYELWAPDPDDPLAFWLYSFPTVGVDVRVTASGVPAALSATSDSLTLSDMYFQPMVDYVCWRALLKDSRGGAKERAMMHEKNYYQALGTERQIVKED